MALFNDYVIIQWIILAVDIFFFIGGIVALAIALALIYRRPGVFRLFDLLNRSVSTRHATRFMSVKRDSRPFVWKYRRPIGIVFVAAAVYSLWGLLAGAGDAEIVSMLNLKVLPDFVLWIVESLRYFMIVGCAVAIIIGVLMLSSPDILKSIESVGARWYSTRKILPHGDKMHLPLDKWVVIFPRTAGLIIVFPALVLVMYFGDLLLKRM